MNQPLLLPPGQQEPTQQQVNVGLRIDQNGLTLRIPISPITCIEQIIPEAMMDQLTAQWLENRREVRRMQQLAQDVMKSKR